MLAVFSPTMAAAFSSRFRFGSSEGGVGQGAGDEGEPAEGQPGEEGNGREAGEGHVVVLPQVLEEVRRLRLLPGLLHDRAGGAV